MDIIYDHEAEHSSSDVPKHSSKRGSQSPDLFPSHWSIKGFSGGSQKIIGVYSGSHLATGAARSVAEGSSLGAPAPSRVQGQRPGGVQGAKPPENCRLCCLFLSMDRNSDLMKSLHFCNIDL